MYTDTAQHLLNVNDINVNNAYFNAINYLKTEKYTVNHKKTFFYGSLCTLN